MHIKQKNMQTKARNPGNTVAATDLHFISLAADYRKQCLEFISL